MALRPRQESVRRSAGCTALILQQDNGGHTPEEQAQRTQNSTELKSTVSLCLASLHMASSVLPISTPQVHVFVCYGGLLIADKEEIRDKENSTTAELLSFVTRVLRVHVSEGPTS